MSNNLDESKIIRKLGAGEALLDFEALHGNICQTRALLTTVSKHHDINMSIISKALEIWVKRHPILQSRIHRVLDERKSILKPDLTKYFVYLDKSVSEYDNVDLIETENEDKWKEIVQEEILTRFKDDNGPT